MSANSINRPDLKVIHEEHHGLKEDLETIRDYVTAPNRNQYTLQDMVQEFVEQITKHFENEEQGGYFANAVRRAPHLADQAEELLQEHEELSEMIVSVNVLARSGVETNAWWEQMEADIARFRVRLLKHEAAETELLQSAYTDDIGAGD